MFIAHLPAGYLLGRTTGNRVDRRGLLAGSVLPDLDLILVFGFGIAQHHHTFLTHKPALWCLVFLMLPSVGLGALLHLVLDSMTGRVTWAWPVSDWALTLVHVPARYDPWWLNFLLHPSFALEVAICVAALLVFCRARRRSSLRRP